MQALQAAGGPVLCLVTQTGPGNLKHGAHAHPNGPAVERITAGGREKHGVHVQGGGGTENGAHIGGVHNAFQHRDPAGPLADVIHGGQLRPPYGA